MSKVDSLSQEGVVFRHEPLKFLDMNHRVFKMFTSKVSIYGFNWFQSRVFWSFSLGFLIIAVEHMFLVFYL